MTAVDDYIANVIGLGDQGSGRLHEICAQTLKRPFVDVLTGSMPVLRIPPGYVIVGHSAGGDPNKKDPESHAASMVQNLVDKSKHIGVYPIAFGNVIDSNTGDIPMLESIANAMVSVADDYGLAIMNGENAILGPRVNADIRANVIGTMISIAKKDELIRHFPKFQRGMARMNGTSYAAFDPKEMAVHINCDGIGTKTEFYERIRQYAKGLGDFAAMNIDDTIKSGATALGLFGMCEMNGDIPFNDILMHAEMLGSEIGVPIFLEFEDVGNRIMSYRPDISAFNISGAAISLIDEGRLKNPPKPSEGEYLIAIKGRPNPRSNGISDKRKIAVKMYGAEYQDTPKGKDLLDFLAEPSTVLYPIFKKLMDEGLATSVYHMSGGAYNGKLARPLAQSGCYAKIRGLFEPDRREIKLSDAMNTSTETAYGKWPMGTDAFATTDDPSRTIDLIRSMGLEAKVVAKIERPIIVNDKQYGGVSLTAYNNEQVEFLHPVDKVA